MLCLKSRLLQNRLFHSRVTIFSFDNYRKTVSRIVTFIFMFHHKCFSFSSFFFYYNFFSKNRRSTSETMICEKNYSESRRLHLSLILIAIFIYLLLLYFAICRDLFNKMEQLLVFVHRKWKNVCEDRFSFVKPRFPPSETKNTRRIVFCDSIYISTFQRREPTNS